MRRFASGKRVRGAAGLLAAIFTLSLASGASAAGTLTVLKSFGINLRAGSDVYGGLLLGASGNLYGTTAGGGSRGAGVVFKLSPNGSGDWTETILYSFKGGQQDGAHPHSTLILDGQGNLYGTTINGGPATSHCGEGCGAVFKLTPGSGGAWTETVLYRFTGGSDGSVPYAGVTLDSAGNLYGATTGGGAKGWGAVYKLASIAGVWTQTVLYSFKGGLDGANPYAAPVLDAASNLYGTTSSGGYRDRGIVYALTPQAGDSWTEQVLHYFKGGADGSEPLSGVILDPAGNLYGATESGGTANCGIAYELAAGAWTESLLHTFLGVSAQDGENPNGLVWDAGGNLYGTTLGGGDFNPGTIFKLAPDHAGGWRETVLYSFTAGLDGAYPSAGLAIDTLGNLYGTTLWGGPSGDTTGGVAFRFTP